MRCFLALFLAGAVLVSRAPAADVQIDEPTRKATTRALEWLASKQNKDGSWGDGQYPHNNAITSFALLAFMAQGHLPNQGLYGPEVAKGCRFLLTSGREDGLLIGAHGGSNTNMYCHAMSTLALAELWGMTGDNTVKPVLKKAVDLIVRVQNHEGGWRYEPNANSDADISVTIMQVMALRAAKNSGLLVPDETLKKAIEYINRCHAQNGGFSYQPGQQPGFARTAAGACVLQLSGHYDAKEITGAVAFLKQNFDTNEHYWYGHYYAAHALHQVGDKEWAEWYDHIRTQLLSHQDANGSWASWKNGGIGADYQTAIAIIILSVPADYLPIFQR